MNARDGSVVQDLLPLVLVVDDETRSLESIQRNLEEDWVVRPPPAAPPAP